EKVPTEPSPVLHFSFSTLGYKELGLEAALHQAIDRQASLFNVTLSQHGLGPRFQELMESLTRRGKKVVLLIDEYDKPLVDYIEQREIAEAHRGILKSLFSVIKDSDAFMEFFLITGVSKFSKVSLFSDLNHLRDLTLVGELSSLTGYTQVELEEHFDQEVKAIAHGKGISVNALWESIKTWYNGYNWSGEAMLYNPFSILNFMSSQKFSNFWWETGTPTFLIRQLRQGFHYDFSELEAGGTLFESYTLDDLEWRSLLFQTGYLTIKGYDEEYDVYALGYPNREVKDSMIQHLMGAFTHESKTQTKPLYAKLKRSLDAKDIPRFISLVDVLLATIPHQIFIEKKEAFFHAVLHLTFQGLGLLTHSEVSTSRGRVDTIVHAKNHIYVMEFKLDGSAESALGQIKKQHYGQGLMEQDKEVVALGINFNSETRTVAEYLVETYQPQN
ncbi:MAG: AAA family ATPase, partial [Bacteroidota bacterium]